MELELADLLAPLSKNDFLNNYWPYRSLFLPAADDKLTELRELPLLQNLESLLVERNTDVRACLPDFEDEYSSILVKPGDALKTYRNGMSWGCLPPAKPISAKPNRWSTLPSQEAAHDCILMPT